MTMQAEITANLFTRNVVKMTLDILLLQGMEIEYVEKKRLLYSIFLVDGSDAEKTYNIFKDTLRDLENE